MESNCPVRRCVIGFFLDEFKKLLDENVVKFPPKGKLGEAFNYTINQWPRLENYLKSG